MGRRRAHSLRRIRDFEHLNLERFDAYLDQSVIQYISTLKNGDPMQTKLDSHLLKKEDKTTEIIEQPPTIIRHFRR